VVAAATVVRGEGREARGGWLEWGRVGLRGEGLCHLLCRQPADGIAAVRLSRQLADGKAGAPLPRGWEGHVACVWPSAVLRRQLC
jgi:hypothetical protein